MIRFILSTILFIFSLNTLIVFDFNKSSAINEWTVVDDVVMGGESSGSFTISDNGVGVFEGTVSLENNGGFSSLRHQMDKTSVEGYDKFIIRLKGDDKEYQFRIKAKSGDYYSYIYPFYTSGEWQKVEIPLSEMYPSFRGRKLDIPNFSNESIEEITFLIGNKRNENFKLMIDKIELK